MSLAPEVSSLRRYIVRIGYSLDTHNAVIDVTAKIKRLSGDKPLQICIEIQSFDDLFYLCPQGRAPKLIY
jgi:hypothetical protein